MAGRSSQGLASCKGSGGAEGDYAASVDEMKSKIGLLSHHPESGNKGVRDALEPYGLRDNTTNQPSSARTGGGQAHDTGRNR